MFLGHPNTDITLVYSSRKEPLQKLGAGGVGEQGGRGSRGSRGAGGVGGDSVRSWSLTAQASTISTLSGYKSQRRYHQGHSLAFEP